MKKTLLLTCLCTAVGSLAYGEALTLTTTFSDKTASSITATTVDDDNTEYTTMVTTERSTTTGNTYNTSSTVGGNTTYLTPNANVGTNATWTSTFTYDMSSLDSYTLSTISLDIVAFKNTGAWQTGEDTVSHDANFTINLYSTANSVDTLLGTATLSWTGGWGSNTSPQTLSAVNFTAADGQSLSNLTADSLKLTVRATKGADNSGCNYGLESITLAGSLPDNTAPVPEPATATLSLLALAGLAARRRRK